MNSFEKVAAMNAKHHLILAVLTAVAALPSQADELPSPVVAWFDARAGVLTVLGDDTDNDIVVVPNCKGVIEVNGGTVPVVGGPAYVAKTRLVDIQGGAGRDILVAGGVPAADLNGGSHADIFIWIDPDPSVSLDGSDLLIWNNGDGSDEGDFNGDGRVDASDYVVWRVAVGEDALYLAVSGDSETQAADYVIWRKTLGEISTVEPDAASTGDFNLWRDHFGQTSAEGGDGTVDIHDYQVWR